MHPRALGRAHVPPRQPDASPGTGRQHHLLRPASPLGLQPRSRDDPDDLRHLAAVILMRRLSLRSVEAFWAYAFLTPFLLGLVLFTLLPIGAALGLSFTRWDLMSAPVFVGLDQYARLL